MMGTAWPSERTRRSALGFQGSFGSQRIWWYMRTVTRWVRESAVEGWPLPAEVVISMESLPRSIAFLLTADEKLMGFAPVGAVDLWVNGALSRRDYGLLDGARGGRIVTGCAG